MDAAAHLFFTEGYGATSIEAIATGAQISKRTFYHRYPDKTAVFKAVVHRLIHQLKPENIEPLFEGKNLEGILLELARVILRASLSPQSLALHRMMLAEALRFPELALVMNEEGARKEATSRIAGLLERDVKVGSLPLRNALFAAEQFLQMVTSVPQRRALGLGHPMSAKELDLWAKNTVTLFLTGWSKS